MRPSLAPVWNGRANAHDFPDDEEPEHVPRGAVRRKTGAKPRAKYRNNDEERRAGDESRVGGDMARYEVAGEEEREKRVGAIAPEESRAGNCRLRPRWTLTCVRSPDSDTTGRTRFGSGPSGSAAKTEFHVASSRLGVYIRQPLSQGLRSARHKLNKSPFYRSAS